MRSSWADSVANAEESAPATGAANGSVANHGNPRPTRSSYVPPHLRGRPAGGGFDAQAGSVAPGSGGCHTCFSKENQVQTYMHVRINFHAYS
jgi:ATP-dependent RNA helicase DDX3X